MFIVRWLMAHPILFIWALTALAIILHLGTKPDTHHGDEQQLAAEHATTAPEHGHDAGNAVEQHAAPAAGQEHEQTVPEAVVQHAQDGAAAVAEAAGNVVDQAADTVSSVAAVETNKMSAPEEAPAAIPVEVPPLNTDALGPGMTGAPASDPAQAAADYATMPSDELLRMAREAFWQNNKEESSRIYELLIQKEPEVLEHKGELGNVYWHQNRQKESASLYAEIAIPLIEKGRGGQVANMLGFIGAFYPEKAAEIHKRLMAEQQ